MAISKLGLVYNDVTLSPGSKNNAVPAESEKSIDYRTVSDPAEYLGRSMVTTCTSSTHRAKRLSVDSLMKKLETSSLPNMVDELIETSPEHKSIWLEFAKLLPAYANAESAEEQDKVPFKEVLAPILYDFSEANAARTSLILNKMQTIQNNRDGYSCQKNRDVAPSAIEKKLEDSFDNLDFSSKEACLAVLKNIAEVHDEEVRQRLLKRFDEKISSFE